MAMGHLQGIVAEGHKLGLPNTIRLFLSLQEVQLCVQVRRGQLLYMLHAGSD